MGGLRLVHENVWNIFFKGDTTAGITGADGVTSYEYKQLEQQNTRLRDTLVRLRDLSAHEKHEIQKISKELETKKSEVNELQRTKKKLSSKVENSKSADGQKIRIFF